MDPHKVLITGVSGYLGAHVLKAFLEAEQRTFEVYGSVRNVYFADEGEIDDEKITPLSEALGENFKRVNFVDIGSLFDKKAIAQACIGKDYVVHVASPYKRRGTEAELVKPAVIGTEAVLEAARAAGVKRVIITSGIVAAMYTDDADKLLFSEEDWSTPDTTFDAYSRGKTMAEKAAWDFVAKNPGCFELVTILPGYIYGPSITWKQFESGETIKRIMLGDMAHVPTAFGAVDVRDVAAAHVQAVIRDEAAGQRIIVSKESISTEEIAEWLHEAYGSNGYSKILGQPEIWSRGTWCFLSSCCCCTLQFRKQTATYHKKIEVSNSKSRALLGIEYKRPMQDTILEMAAHLINIGYI